MKRYLLIASLILAALSTVAAPVNSALFPKSSPLAKGKWIKVFVEETGIYEISYDDLRAMGFSNPQMVSVFGQGGRLLDENFSNMSGVASHNGSIAQVPVYYGADCIYFYGLGTENITFTSDTKLEGKGKFTRASKNVYTKYGTYMLTDSTPKLTLMNANTSTSGTNVTTLVDYAYYEKDLQYNPSLSGQLFWGEVFGYGNPNKYSFPMVTDDAIPGTKAYLQCDYYYTDAPLSIVNIGFGNSEEKMSLTVPSSQTYNYVPLSRAYQEMDLLEGTNSIDIEFEPSSPTARGMLDYWLVTYQKSAPTLSGVGQSHVTVPTIKNGNYYRFVLSPEMPIGTQIWDVTNPLVPTNVPYASGEVCAKATAANPSLVFFDPTRIQKQILSYESMGNSDLHAQAQGGIDLLIITTKSFVDYARQIAELHETYDGMNVLVALDTDIYNEFKGGSPDPMAYKWLIKMLREYKARPVQNVLFFGPMGNDLRGILSDGQPKESLIAYQSTNVSRTTGAINVNDWYGILSNYSNLNSWEREMEIGVGILPVLNDREAGVAVEKIRRWLTDDSFAYRVNSLMHYSSAGDEHLSDISAIESTARLDNGLNNSMIITPLVIDDYGSEDARRKMCQTLANGNLFNIYYGHGDPTWISANDKFFGPSHLNLLKNEPLSFTIFAGCSLSNFDRGNGGIGKMMTLDNHNGLIGTILATRETYANENVQITNAIIDAILNCGAGASIGQMFARSKSKLNLAHEHQYQLMCDPALIIPFPFMKLDVEHLNGPDSNNFITLTGKVVDNEGNEITDFNGDVVVRVLAEEKTVLCRGVLSDDDVDLPITYADETLSIASGTVTDGRFSISVFVPAESGDTPTPFKGSVALAAYDASHHFGAASRTYVDLMISPLEPASKVDNTAPFVTLDYDDVDVKIAMTIKDNLRLNLANTPLKESYALYLDGSMLPSSYAGLVYVDPDSKEARYIVRLPNITDGTHTFMVEAKDFAGNKTSTELVFDVGVLNTNINLRMYHAAMRHEGYFILEDDIPADGLWFVVEDPTGEIIARKHVYTPEFSWNKDELLKEQFVRPGVYKAYVTSRNADTHVWSNKIHLPILDN